MPIDRRTIIKGVATLAVASAIDGVTSNAAEPNMDFQAERVLGIGGIFFRSHDPQKLAEWYQHHLGINPVPTDYGGTPWQQAAGPTVFAPFPETTKYFGSPQQMWMLNFRVRNLDAMVAQLQKSHIEVKVDPEKYPNGRFGRLHDPEGNPIELWEPAGPA